MKMGEKIKKNLPLVKLLRPMMTMPATPNPINSPLCYDWVTLLSNWSISWYKVIYSYVFFQMNY